MSMISTASGASSRCGAGEFAVGHVLPRDGVEQAGLGVDRRGGLELAHPGAALQRDHRRQHEHAQQRLVQDGQRDQTAQAQRGELDQVVVVAAEQRPAADADAEQGDGDQQAVDPGLDQR